MYNVGNEIKIVKNCDLFLKDKILSNVRNDHALFVTAASGRLFWGPIHKKILRQT